LTSSNCFFPTQPIIVLKENVTSCQHVKLNKHWWLNVSPCRVHTLFMSAWFGRPQNWKREIYTHSWVVWVLLCWKLTLSVHNDSSISDLTLKAFSHKLGKHLVSLWTWSPFSEIVFKIYKYIYLYKYLGWYLKYIFVYIVGWYVFYVCSSATHLTFLFFCGISFWHTKCFFLWPWLN
jgi:hypothetical protein